MHPIVSIGDRLLEERRRLDLNQTEMGKLGGVAYGTYANYELNKRFPDAECLAKLYAAGVDVLYVISGVRNVATLSNRDSVLLEQFHQMDTRAQRATLALMQTYNTPAA